MSDEPEEIPQDQPEEETHLTEARQVSGMYEDWFLEYASYVILERAVPAIEDGLKPVQRRILHAMKVIDDGRFNKVANIIGQTMQYHPHGDAAIGDAMVNLGQKDLLIETQGNWGDIRTGDSAAAPRYIEARLSKFALEVAFNNETTEWQLSYDGRKKEPVTLPMKFPLLLAQGVEGIAVGLSTKIMPHNFQELIKGSIQILKGRNVKLYPDFPTGGMADVEEYNGGLRGGKIKVRARIDTVDKKTLAIREIPYGTTTTGLIDNILKANDKGKIKIKKVVDNTAKDVEILIELASGISPDVTVDALYAFTDCEVSISPNACVIIDEKPVFMTVNEILKYNTEQTKDLLRRELEIKKRDLEEKWHFSSLEKIFIEKRIYRDIEEEETWEGVISAIDKGLDPYKKLFKREITEEDIVKLTEIKIKRISKFDSFKADELIKKLEDDLAQVQHDLEHLTDYAIAYYERLLEKFGKGKERKTELRTFDTIAAKQVVVANQKLYVNREEGFVGYGLRKDEYIEDCSDIDDVIVFMRDGRYMVSKVSEKAFFGKDIIHAGVWKRGDDRMTYNAVYVDGKSKRTFVKRFAVPSVTRDREYHVTAGAPNSRVLHLSANPNGEAEVITVYLSASAKARVKQFDFDFADLDIKGRGSKGNTLTKYTVRKIEVKSKGESTLGGLDIWLDETVGRLNTDERGRYLGNFMGDDLILAIYKDGSYELTSFELTNRYEMGDIQIIKKLAKDEVLSVIHYDAERKNYFVKRFEIENTATGQRYDFISEGKNSKLVFVSVDKRPNVEVQVEKGKSKTKDTETIALADFIDVKGWKSLGNRLSMHKVKKVVELEPDEPGDEETGDKEISTETGVQSTENDTPDPLDEKEADKDSGKPEPEEAEEETQDTRHETQEGSEEEDETNSPSGGGQGEVSQRELEGESEEEEPETEDRIVSPSGGEQGDVDPAGDEAKDDEVDVGDSLEWDMEKPAEKPSIKKTKPKPKGPDNQGSLF